MSIYFIKNKQGFTLIELLVSMAVFVLLVVAIITVYLSFNSSQIRTATTQQLLNDSQYAIDVVSKEIRNNAIVRYQYAVEDCGDLLIADVTDKFEDCIILERENGQFFAFTRHHYDGSGEIRLLYLLLTYNGSTYDVSSSIEILSPGLNNINIDFLNFFITPSQDPFVVGGPDLQPKVTISIGTSYISDNKFKNVKNVFQTSVSSRVYRR